MNNWGKTLETISSLLTIKLLIHHLKQRFKIKKKQFIIKKKELA